MERETDGGESDSSADALPRELDDAMPEAAVDAACALMLPTSYGSPGNCSTILGETCGTTSYQVSCDCPKGICTCFGPTTHVVAYDSCPSCPLLSGPTVNAVFRLCGFP